MKNILVFIFLILYSSYTLYSKSITVKFYSEEIVLEYDVDMIIKNKVKQKDKSVNAFFEELETTDYEKLIKELIKTKYNLNLNDWLYYRLIQNFTEVVAPKKNVDYWTVLNAFLLAKSGFDVRLCYDKQIDLYVYTEDKVYFSNRFYKRKKSYYNLSYFSHPKIKRKTELKLSKIILNRNGSQFSFKMKELPRFKTPEIYNKEISFKNNVIDIKINKTIIDVFKGYPTLQKEFYFQVPLSNDAYDSFIIPFKEKLKNLDNSVAVREMLSFVRLQNEYRNDLVSFGKEKPMIPEEVLFYNYADCEDKSALFYYLINELLDLPMIILYYPNHVNVAVELLGNYGEPIIYKDKNYYVCEPSTLFDNTDIGYSKIGQEYTPEIIDLSTQ